MLKNANKVIGQTGKVHNARSFLFFVFYFNFYNTVSLGAHH